jgi:hypothetical protein
MLVFFGGICQLPDPREWLPGRMRRFKLNSAAEIIRNKKIKNPVTNLEPPTILSDL